MITILASLLGFLTSLLPHILDYFKDKQDKAHELACMDRQIALQEQQSYNQLQEVQVQAQSAEMQSIHLADKPTGRWTDWLNASVRPVIAYGMFFEYAWIRYKIYNYMVTEYIAVNGSLDLKFLLETLHDNQDMAIFSSIITFYFGNRYFEKKFS